MNNVHRACPSVLSSSRLIASRWERRVRHWTQNQLAVALLSVRIECFFLFFVRVKVEYWSYFKKWGRDWELLTLEAN